MTPYRTSRDKSRAAFLVGLSCGIVGTLVLFVVMLVHRLPETAPW